MSETPETLPLFLQPTLQTTFFPRLSSCTCLSNTETGGNLFRGPLTTFGHTPKNSKSTIAMPGERFAPGFGPNGQRPVPRSQRLASNTMAVRCHVILWRCARGLTFCTHVCIHEAAGNIKRF